MGKATILIVEDEAIVAADLSGKLGQLGYDDQRHDGSR